MPIRELQDGAGGGEVNQMVIVSIRGDYLSCKVLEGSSGAGTGDEILVAKPFLLRKSPFDNKVREGVLYKYLSPVRRDASSMDPAYHDCWLEVVTPSYLIGDIIYAVDVKQELNINSVEDGSKKVKLIDINVDSRRWAREMDVCVEIAGRVINKKQLVVASQLYNLTTS